MYATFVQFLRTLGGKGNFWQEGKLESGWLGGKDAI
jgi:hypothetical protein